MTSAVLVWIHGLIQLVHERLRCVGVSGSFFPDELLLKRDSRFFLPALSFGLETLVSTQFSVAKTSSSNQCHWSKDQPTKEPGKAAVTLVTSNYRCIEAARDPYKEEANQEAHHQSVTAL